MQEIMWISTIRYPFGTSPGCGDPRFQKYVTCDGDRLTFATHSGCYTIQNIDYTNQVFYIQDPSMSTCLSTQSSKGFGLDWDAPFTFIEDNVFALLDCSTSASPLFNSQLRTDGNNSLMPLCDNEGTPICSFLYSCPAISTLNLPISTCCVYTPVDLGPAYDMDLQKLHCSSYTGVYSFNGQESNPENWKYGVALKYKFNVKNEFPGYCSNCERSNGVCGYNLNNYNSFLCNCVGGVNTTTDCYFGASWSKSKKILPWPIGTWLIFSVAWYLNWVLL
ncbi:hypothetical protein Syun_023859 [Stephania yunnanensis]|uniref:Uncharacterized protein n=1 Tax=Stephania yunnanensis TaxID=152371 RepID=A0AAP0I000_9MAGN